LPHPPPLQVACPPLPKGAWILSPTLTLPFGEKGKVASYFGVREGCKQLSPALPFGVREG